MANIKVDSEIILYDLASQLPSTSWSLNPWKTRLALNFKGVNYKTQWVEYPDIAPLLASLNVKPNSSRTPYTLPAVRFSNGETIQDSRIIVEKIEEIFPSPSLHLVAPILPEIQKTVSRAFFDLFTILNPTKILNPPSAAYFTRKDAENILEYGPDLEGEDAWDAAKEPLRKLAGLIQSPFVLGEQISYADFVVMGFLRHAWVVGGKKVWERVVGIDQNGKLRRLYEAVKEKGLLEKSG